MSRRKASDTAQNVFQRNAHKVLVWLLCQLFSLLGGMAPEILLYCPEMRFSKSQFSSLLWNGTVLDLAGLKEEPQLWSLRVLQGEHWCRDWGRSPPGSVPMGFALPALFYSISKVLAPVCRCGGVPVCRCGGAAADACVCRRASAWCCTCWCAAPCPSTGARCRTCARGCSAGSSAFPSSCPQVRRAREGAGWALGGRGVPSAHSRSAALRLQPGSWSVCQGACPLGAALEHELN